MERGGCVYILASKNNSVMYIGVTSDLYNRTREHKRKEHTDSFTAKYNCDKLVYFEIFHSIEKAIIKEKRLKKWNREWKENLINEFNPTWKDLTDTLL